MTDGEPATRTVRDRRLGLRIRVTAAFALISCIVVVALSLVTYFVAQRYLVQQRERSATRQAFLDARLVRDELVDRTRAPADALTQLELSPRSQAAFVRDGTWFGSSIAIGPETLPSSFVRLVIDGHAAAHQRVDLAGETRYVVGVPIPAAGGVYVEAFSLQELDDTLGVLRNALVAGVVAAPVAGGLLGLWASRRVLRPLGEVSAAAAQIAAGDLDARLEPPGDPDLARMAESFNAMVDALTERMARDARFASDVSHELRSPLTTLATAASVLQARRDDLPPRLREASALVAEEVQRFQELVEGLLELSRLQAGAEVVQLEPVHLGELVLHVAGRTPPHDLTLEIDPGLDAEGLLLDKRRVERVLVNLLENAREHAGGAVAVTVRLQGDVVRLGVEDAGPGVPPADRQLIFERFARGRRAGSRGDTLGSGLGLALVAEHVRLMGGRVWVEGRGGAPGACFVVELPRRTP